MRVHKVKQGECLSAIAVSYGFYNWETLYNLAENANLRKTRPNPNILYPGDKVYVPDKEMRSESVSTEVRHSFVKKNIRAELGLVLQDEEGEPYADMYYELNMGVGEGDPEVGITDLDGKLVHELRNAAKHVRLMIWLDSEKGADSFVCQIELEVDLLDPLDEVSGVQARLQNLGCSCGFIDGISGPKTSAGVKKFQLMRDIVADGIIGSITKSELEIAYGC